MAYNNAILTSAQLATVTATVKQPLSTELSARKYIKAQKIPSYLTIFPYKFMVSSGKATLMTNRATDAPLVDTKVVEEFARVAKFHAAFDYSREELEEANAVNFNLFQNKATVVRRALAEFQNKLLFNGIDMVPAGANDSQNRNLLGLTTEPSVSGVQTAKAPVTFDAALNDEDGQMKLRNYLQDCVDQIQIMPGFSGQKPVLLLPPKALSYLKRPFNKYNPESSVYSMVKDFFTVVDGITELSGKYTKSSEDMGIVMVNTSDVMEYGLAQDAFPEQPRPLSGGGTRQEFTERCTGLLLYRPEAVVQLTGISTPSKSA